MNPFSNSPPGYPDTSDSGYPLFWAIGGDGLPVGVPRLVYDGQTFADEAEVESYKVRARARDGNLESWRKAWEAEVHTGFFPATTITQEEGWHLRQLAYTRGNSIWYVACSGSNVDINRVRNASYYNPAPDGWVYMIDNTRFGQHPELWPIATPATDGGTDNVPRETQRTE